MGSHVRSSIRMLIWHLGRGVGLRFSMNSSGVSSSGLFLGMSLMMVGEERNQYNGQTENIMNNGNSKDIKKTHR